MDLADDLRYLAETLVPPKPGIIVAIATERVISGGSLPEHAYEQLGVDEWRAFCHDVWHAEVPGPCGLITRHRSSTASGKSGSRHVPYCETASSPRTRPVIEVDDAGLTQLGALHEIAHLLVDGDIPAGHRPRYIEKFVDLVSRRVSPQAATDWYNEWTVVLRWADDGEGRPSGAAVRGSSS
jgi:hypothetical protein